MIKKYFIPLTLVISLLLTFIVSIFFYSNYADATAQSIVDNFKKENAKEFAQGDTSSLTERLNFLLPSLNWVCVSVKKNDQTFFKIEKGNCDNGFFNKKVEVVATGSDLKVTLTLRLAHSLENFVIVFVSLIVLTTFLAGLLIIANLRSNHLHALSLKNLELKNIEKLNQIAAQVSHDIRSPLTALDMAIKDAENLPEELRVAIRGSASRIRDIANNLLGANRASKGDSKEAGQVEAQKIETILLSSAIDTLVSEKRMQFRSKLGVQIDFDLTTEGYGLFSKVELREFKRILSNLINNSVEALNEGGNVRVILNSNGGDIEVKVTDNGKGIPPEVLLRLGQKGETFGKAEGNGLGLYHARTTLESWGGGLTFESTVGVGTTLTIKLKKCESLKWFVEGLIFQKNSRVVVIDDDSSIHHIWDGRFQSSFPNDSEIEVVHLSTPELAKSWYAEFGDKKETKYLIDFEFIGSSMNGLELIRELNLSKSAILVTSRYEEERIMRKCLKDEMKLIPKNLSAYVPIKVSEPIVPYDYVYIEDDELLRWGWKKAAKRKKINLLILEKTSEFEKYLDQIDKEKTLIYVDNQLTEGDLSGVEFATILHEKGFKNIFIATGYERERFAHLAWLGYSGKDCPFDDED